MLFELVDQVRSGGGPGQPGHVPGARPGALAPQVAEQQTDDHHGGEAEAEPWPEMMEGRHGSPLSHAPERGRGPQPGPNHFAPGQVEPFGSDTIRTSAMAKRSGPLASTAKGALTLLTSTPLL